MEEKPKRRLWLLWVVGGFIALVIIGSLTDDRSRPRNTPTAQAEPSALIGNNGANAAAETIPPTPATAWTYDTESSPMDDRATEFACVRSTNTVELGFPYGSPYGRLCLRNSPQFGRDAYVELDGEGQILCQSYRSCAVRIRFDDAQATSFSAIGPSDNSSNIVFIENRDRLERALRSAQRTAIQIEFYRAGQQAFLFPTAGFDWDAGRRERAP